MNGTQRKYLKERLVSLRDAAIQRIANKAPKASAAERDLTKRLQKGRGYNSNTLAVDTPQSRSLAEHERCVKELTKVVQRQKEEAYEAAERKRDDMRKLRTQGTDAAAKRVEKEFTKVWEAVLFGHDVADLQVLLRDFEEAIA